MTTDGVIYVEELILYLLECGYSVSDIERFLQGLDQISTRDVVREDTGIYDDYDNDEETTDAIGEPN